MPDFMIFLHSEQRFFPRLCPECSAYYWNNSAIIKKMTLYRCGSWHCGADPKTLKVDKTMEDGRDFRGTCKCDQIHQLTSTINKPAVIKQVIKLPLKRKDSLFHHTFLSPSIGLLLKISYDQQHLVSLYSHLIGGTEALSTKQGKLIAMLGFHIL